MIKCVAIDDEPIALEIIKEYCSRYGNIALQCFTSPVAGMECIDATRPDIVLLDIEMNSHNGLDLARRMPPGTCVIFTTAYSQYALDGFDADAIDFLHKPIFYPRFTRAMEKAMKWTGVKEAGATRCDTIALKVEHRNVVVDTATITHIEAMDNYVKIHRRNLPMVLSQITMKEMEAMLPEDRFICVHRSFIVAINAIESFSNRRISLRNSGRHIPVGRKYIAAFNNLDNIFKPSTTYPDK